MEPQAIDKLVSSSSDGGLLESIMTRGSLEAMSQHHNSVGDKL